MIRILLTILSILFIQTGYCQKTYHATFGSEIVSVDSDNFSDLSFLDSLIQGKRIVFLGESSHGINDFNQMKFRIIRYLNQNHGFDVVAFESGVSTCGLTNLFKDSLSGMQMLVHSLLGIWRVQGNCSMMDYFRNHQIDLAGIDPNNTALPFDRKQLNLILRNPDLSQRLSELDSLFLYKFSIPKERLYWKKEIVSEKHLDSVAAALKKAFQITRSEISKLAYLDNKQKNIFIKAIESQIECLSVSNDPKNKRFYVILHERDSLMAKNLEYLADTLYANRKIIVWAHNAHINKIENERINAGASIGCYLKNPIKEKSLVIGLYATSGQYGIGMKSCNTIKYKKHSFETLYGNFKNKALFIESKNIENKMYRNGIPNNFPANVSKMFDGVILIRDVSCSKLIKYNKDFICE